MVSANPSIENTFTPTTPITEVPASSPSPVTETSPTDRYEEVLTFSDRIEKLEENVAAQEAVVDENRQKVENSNFLNRGIRETALTKSEEELGIDQRKLSGAQESQLKKLGGETLVNASEETKQHAINPQRLETLVDANKKGGPVGHVSQEGQDFFAKQQGLSQKLKLEGEAKLEAERKEKALEKFLDTHKQRINEYNDRARENEYQTELILTEDEIRFAAEQSLHENPNSEYLTTEMSSWEIRKKMTDIDRDARYSSSTQVEIEKAILESNLKGITELETSFYTSVAFLNLAKQEAQETKTDVDLAKFKQVYNKSKALFAQKPEHYERLMRKSELHEQVVLGIEHSRGFKRGYTTGLCQEAAEVIGKNYVTELAPEEYPYAYAYYSAIVKQGIKPIDPNNLLGGMTHTFLNGLDPEKDYNTAMEKYNDLKNRFKGIRQILYLAHNPSYINNISGF